MKKWFAVIAAVFLFLWLSPGAQAAEISSDTMILDWSTNKVWIDHGNLCVRGTFYNKRSDLTVTKLNSMTMKIIFTKSDGSKSEFSGKPVKLPMLKIGAGGSKAVTLNFGPYEGTWSSWNTDEYYEFSYIPGSRW